MALPMFPACVSSEKVFLKKEMTEAGHNVTLPPPPPQKNYLRKKILEELFSGPLQQFCVINYAKEFSEKYFLRSYANFA